MRTSNKLIFAYLNTFIFSSMQMMLYVTIPFISEKSSVSITHIAGSISIGSLFFALTGPLWASFSDKYGRKKFLSLGMLAFGLSFLLLSFCITLHLESSVKIFLIYLSRIIYGVFASAIVPVSQAYQLDHFSNQERIKVLTKNSMCLNLGKIFAPLLVLYKQVNFEILITGGTILILLIAVYEIFFLSDEKRIYKEELTRFDFKNYIQLIKLALFPILLALVFTSFIGILHSTLGHHLKLILNIKGNEATLLMAKIVLVISILGAVTNFLSQKFWKLKWQWNLKLGVSALCFGAIILNFAQNLIVIWMSVIILALGLALIPPVYLSLISKKNATENFHGRQLGLATIAHSLGYALGAGLIAISIKLEILSITAVILFISLILILLATKLISTRDVY